MSDDNKKADGSSVPKDPASLVNRISEVRLKTGGRGFKLHVNLDHPAIPFLESGIDDDAETGIDSYLDELSDPNFKPYLNFEFNKDYFKSDQLNPDDKRRGAEKLDYEPSSIDGLNLDEPPPAISQMLARELPFFKQLKIKTLDTGSGNSLYTFLPENISGAYRKWAEKFTVKPETTENSFQEIAERHRQERADTPLGNEWSAMVKRHGAEVQDAVKAGARMSNASTFKTFDV